MEISRSTICSWHEQLATMVERLVAAMRDDAFTARYLCVDATGVLVQAKEKCRRGHLWVLASERLTEVNCWAHARRYFFKAMGSDPGQSKGALGLIGALFRIERSIAESARKKREQVRAKRSASIVERFLSWCDAEFPQLLEDTPQSAVGEKAAEARKKNWIFLGSDDGGRVNSVFTSLLASCRMLDVEPWSYLRDLLCLLPRWAQHRLLDLAPVNWSITIARDDVKRTLDLDPYGLLTLGG